MLPALHFLKSHRGTHHRIWRALKCKRFLFNTTLPFCIFRSTLELTASIGSLKNSTGVVTLLVTSSCLILESLVLHCHSLFLFSRHCLPQKESMNINHLPSSMDYIQAFFFSLICNFPFPIHSQNKHNPFCS